jgi:hypothetical protein
MILKSIKKINKCFFIVAISLILLKILCALFLFEKA